MSLFQNFVWSHLEHKDDSKSKQIKNIFMNEHLKKSKNGFHIDCHYTKKRVCFCNLHESSMMPKSEIEKYATLSSYLTEVYEGREKLYESFAEIKQFLQEKFLNMQEPEDYAFYQNIHKEKKIKEFRDPNDPKDQKKDLISNMPTKKIHLEHGHLTLRPTGHYISATNHDGDQPKKRGRRPHKQNLTEYRKKNETEVEEICHYDKCSKDSDKEDFLFCKNCHRRFHAKCCDPPLNKNIVTLYDWYCNECKVCTICNSHTDENNMLICDICDRAFHLNCMTPKLKEIPPNEWYCSNCTTCQNCEKDLKSESGFPNLEKNLTESKQLFCHECISAHNSKNGYNASQPVDQI